MSNPNRDFIEIQKTLLGFSSQVKETVKEQGDRILHYLLQLNEHMRYINAHQADLNTKNAPANPAKKKKLENVHGEISSQNVILKRLQVEFAKAVLLNLPKAPTMLKTAPQLSATLDKTISNEMKQLGKIEQQDLGKESHARLKPGGSGS